MVSAFCVLLQKLLSQGNKDFLLFSSPIHFIVLVFKFFFSVVVSFLALSLTLHTSSGRLEKPPVQMSGAFSMSLHSLGALPHDVQTFLAPWTSIYLFNLTLPEVALPVPQSFWCLKAESLELTLVILFSLRLQSEKLLFSIFCPVF